MRQVLGTAVFSGMLGVTIFGIFFTPVFFYVIQWASDSELFASPLARRLSFLALAVLVLVSFGVLGVLLFLSRMLVLLVIVLGFGLVVVGHMAVRHLGPLVVARAPAPPGNGDGPVTRK